MMPSRPLGSLEYIVIYGGLGGCLGTSCNTTMSSG